MRRIACSEELQRRGRPSNHADVITGGTGGRWSDTTAAIACRAVPPCGYCRPSCLSSSMRLRTPNRHVAASRRVDAAGMSPDRPRREPGDVPGRCQSTRTDVASVTVALCQLDVEAEAGPRADGQYRRRPAECAHAEAGTPPSPMTTRRAIWLSVATGDADAEGAEVRSFVGITEHGWDIGTAIRPPQPSSVTRAGGHDRRYLRVVDGSRHRRRERAAIATTGRSISDEIGPARSEAVGSL